VASVGQAGHGVLHLAMRGIASAKQLAEAFLRPLRAELAGEGGSAVVERAPAELKAQIDVWGPVAPETFAIMERLKREFDPQGILNPGRFVGGL
jgi:glycolate oxidase FAD binding subunit